MVPEDAAAVRKIFARYLDLGSVGALAQELDQEGVRNRPRIGLDNARGGEARIGVLLLGGLMLAFLSGVFLARKMVGPIQKLRAGARRIGSGDLTQRILIKTGDELEGLRNCITPFTSRRDRLRPWGGRTRTAESGHELSL